MHADTINLLSSGGYYATVYSFPAGSLYSQYYGTGIGIVETYNPQNGYYAEAYGGTTVGSITKFSNAYLYSSVWQGSLSNSVFNAKTDVFTGTFALNGKTWHLQESFYPPNNGFTYNYNGYSYSAYSSNVKSATLTTPEPSTLGLLGTGLFMIAGIARKRLVGQQSYSI
jgi:hypothetical protein